MDSHPSGQGNPPQGSIHIAKREGGRAETRGDVSDNLESSGTSDLHSQAKNSDQEKEPNESCNCNPTQATQQVSHMAQVDFYLHIQRCHANEAFVEFSNAEKPFPLKRIMKVDDGDLWTQTCSFSTDPTSICYRYHLSFTEGYWLFPGNPKGVAEVSRRTINSTVQYDTFHSPDDKKYRESIPLSSVVYTKWLFKFINDKNVKAILMQIECMKFELSVSSLKQVVAWILEQTRCPSVTDEQCLYLSIVLGHLARDNSRNFSMPTDNKTKASSDRLLQSFEALSRFSLLPSSSQKTVERIAPFLVNSSSYPCWLSVAAHFYPYLGIKYLVHKKMNESKCDTKEFWRLVNLLLSVLAKNEDTLQFGKKLLHNLLQTAPDRKAVVVLYKSRDFDGFFVSKSDKEDFFVDFLASSFRHRTEKRGNQGENLVDMANIPDELLCKMTRLVSTSMLDFAESAHEPNEAHIEAFCKLITLHSMSLPIEKLESVLTELARSKLPQLRDVLLRLLNDKAFHPYWHKFTLQEKVDICYAWILTKLRLRSNRDDPGEEILAAYKAVEQLTLCDLNANNKALVEKICKNVADRIFRTAEASTILGVHKVVEKYSEVIQECYKNHVRDMLQRDPRLVRKAIAEVDSLSYSFISSKLSTEHRLSRLGQDLLLCVLEVVEIPSPKDDAVGFDDFKDMLEWSDVWITLLSAKGTVRKLQNTSKFILGKKNWQILASCVTDGRISLTFLKDVERHKEKLSFIFALVNAKPSACDSELSKEKQRYLTCISTLLQVNDDCGKKFALLESAINYCRNVSNDITTIDGISQLLSEFHQRQSKWKTQKLPKQLDDKSWGPLLPLLKPAKTLQPLINSVSFMNMAKICLREINADSSLDEESVIIDFHFLLQFLTSTVIERFQIQWNPVFSDPGTLTVETIERLLGSLKNQENLEEEFNFLREYFRREFSCDVTLYIESYVNYPRVLKQVKHLTAILETFQLNDSLNDAWSTTLISFERNIDDNNGLTLLKLHQSMLSVREIVSDFTGDEIEGVVEELGRSKELLAFLEEIVDEDIRFLIDAVEEHSDQFVSESSVSDLIDVHGCLAPLIKNRRLGCNVQQFFSDLKKLCWSYKGMAVKLYQCSTNVNSLRGLYASVANRGEITKEIIANCLKKGRYSVSLNEDGVCEAKMSYERSEQKAANYSLYDLHDLRSRAHLIVNSDKNISKASPVAGKNADIDFADFIIQVNLLTDITTLLSKLWSSGYVKYRKFWKVMKSTNNLQAAKDKLQQELEAWESILSNAREQHYFLNYYRSDQLGVLHDFLTNRSKVDFEDVLSLIHFVDPNIKKEQLNQYRKFIYQEDKQTNLTTDPHEIISHIGVALDKIFAKTNPVVRSVFKNRNDLQGRSTFFASQFTATVKPGELFVASLEEESQLTANVLLSLYENTSKAFPEPYQVVFCSPQTTWEEVHLVLRRCFAQSERLNRDSLFCIANVELLASEIQFKLVNAIKEVHNDNHYSEQSKKKRGHRLSLICRGGDHHHIVEQFSQYAHHIAGMSDSALSQRLVFSWPEVTVITSSLPGLGKTERIKKEALSKEMNVVTFSISGPLDQSKLVQRLKQLDLKAYHCLHLDVGEVNDPLWLDTFLFQLIVIGMVSSGTQFYHFRAKHVYIEVANTLKDWLRDSLVICKYFSRFHLQWQQYEDLVVSSEITSSIQIVCQYFDGFDRARLESNDIYFTGPRKVKPLPADRCQQLLAKYYSSDADITFTTLNTFLAVLADQLLKFSRSAFFKISNLKSMLGKGTHNVRTKLFQALLEVSKEFAARSMTTCRASKSEALSPQESAEALDKATATRVMSAQHMVERVERMIRWEDSNHLLIVFHGISSQTIAAVYRNRSRVPFNVEKLLTSQVVKRKSNELEDFKVMSQDQLQEKLERIVCTKLVKKDYDHPTYLNYALTPDNMLKMILIILRVRANAPVIIMGETGCGKTSLVRYLANTCGITFFTFNFHAGITEEEVINFIIEKEADVKKCGQKTWIFLDEINTCDHLGLISDILCHHTLLGRVLSKDLVFLAACNPYKLRPKEHIKTAGLEGKNTTDEYSRLVYRVHQLPEAMVDYVWDYGSLAPKDEKAYIHRMIREIPTEHQGLMVDLLADSQKFIREVEKNHFCVSLRDVYRCIVLTKWFKKMSTKRKLNDGKDHPDQQHLNMYRRRAERYNSKPWIKSIVLALAHCYQSRLPTAELRREYRKRMMILFSSQGTIMNTVEGTTDSFSAIVRMEEEDYLNRMELPSGTAKNAALRENVFVMLVCILNRIPVFVVGKPGCSKSLSIQLIRSNLRGRDSKDSFFRKLPQLYVVSYQGSESSTSEGIIKVFQKARKYKEHNQGGNVLPVVLLDEVGLAENSKYNPLKVLHSILEPGDGQSPDVAVVGISNWSLDAAKMNRAIHLSRPDPDMDDLYETGKSLHYTDGIERNRMQSIGNDELHYLAEAYFEYQSKQRYANFHGLRDYYSLIKSLSLRRGIALQQISIALQRNFGGIHGELTNIRKIFLDKLKQCMPVSLSSEDDAVPVTKLIQENLTDPLARHLMLITSGDSAIGILKQNLAQLKKEIIIIFGSRFEEDISEEYNYRILSRIILCMERNCILILRDLESIYGSLYDMLNQNYAVVGKRKNCRVALGAYSNPMCQVNDGFRCIVLTDHQKVDYSDPPFLNRFEKQLLRFSDVLDARQRSIINLLHDWVQQISTIRDHESHFKVTDMFIGYHEDTLSSLVLLHSQNPDVTVEDIVQKSKDDLMWIAAPDGVLRAHMSDRLKDDSSEVKMLSDEYFKRPLHKGLATFINALTNEESPFFCGDEIGTKIIVMTFSNVHTDILKCLGETVRCQAERLSAYKSEKQLAERVNHYWMNPEADLLVLQCKPELDAEHLLLARSIIDEKRSTFKQVCEETGVKQKKHVCIVIHVQRETTSESASWRFSFLCGWKQVFLDVLDAPPVPLNEILSASVTELLTSTIWPLNKIAQDVLLWCFTCIKYKRQQRSLKRILYIVKNLLGSSKVYTVIKQLVLQWVNVHQEEQDVGAVFSERWQVKVACDRQALVNCSSLYSAMEHHVSSLVREPLAKIIYFLEKENAWPPHVLSQWEDDDLKSACEDLWCEFILREDFFNFEEIPAPLGAESYTLDCVNLELHLPFIQLLIRRIDGIKDLFLEDHTHLKDNESNLDHTGQLTSDVQLQLMKRYSEIISYRVPETNEFPPDSSNAYMADLFNLISADFNAMKNHHLRISNVKAAYVSYLKHSVQSKDASHFYAHLHTFVWAHKEEILHLLRMVVSCRSFVDPNVSACLAGKYLSSKLDVLTYVNNDGFPMSEQSGKSDREESSADQCKLLPETRPEECNEVDKANSNNVILSNVESQCEKEDLIDESSASSSKNGDKEQESFQDLLVTAYCEKMLPSQEVLQNQEGLHPWMRNSCLLLTLACKISDPTTAYHFLRLCVDFARIVVNSSTARQESLNLLYILNEIGVTLKPEYLDADKSFEKINGSLISALQNEIKLKFSALFFGRCIDTNADTYSVPTIVQHVLSLDRADLVLMMSPVILRLLMVEESESPGVFAEIIFNPSVIGERPCLRAIDEEFTSLTLGGELHNDSYAAVMICDLIQSLLNSGGRLSIEDLNSSDCAVLTCVNKAAGILSHDAEDNCGLKVLSAVAYLRWFFTLLSRFIADKVNYLRDDSVYAHLMNDINSILSFVIANDARRLSLQHFFLKQLRQHNSFFDLHKLCCESEMLPALKTMWDANQFVEKAKFESVCKLEEYQQVKSAYFNLKNDDENQMLAYLDQCQYSSNHRLALLGILVNKIYLKRAVRKLTDKEECLVRWFGGKFELFCLPLKELLLRIVGLKDFKSSHLQLSPESSVDEVEMALMMVHVFCVIASGIDDAVNSPFYQYFTNPTACQNTFILADGEERKQQLLEMRDFANSSSPFMCICGLRSTFSDHQQTCKCPNCGEIYKPEIKFTSSTTDGVAQTSTRGYSPVQTPKLSRWDTCMGHMNPPVFRALHFLVHASLYAGAAIELTSTTDLSLLLNTGGGSSSETGEECLRPQQYLFEHVITDLVNLTVILDCTKEHALKVMHLVVETCTDLLRGSINGTVCSTKEERRAWEITFSHLAGPLLKEALLPITALKGITNKAQQPGSQQMDSLEDQIEELDDYPVEPKKQNQQLKRLFRVTREPTFENFRANFMNSPEDFRERHRFLSLFFAKFDELPLIHNAYHLLKWVRIVSSVLCYRISRKEAQLNSINDFIHGHLLKLNRTPEEIESLKKIFSNFENAWNDTRYLVNQKLEPDEKEMPRLTEESEIAYCIIESDCGVYLLTALKILSSLQNTILDELIFLSASYHHPALRFLEQNGNCSGIPSVSLQEAKEQDFIIFQWSNDIAKITDQDLEIGEGEEILRDKKITTQWCDEVFKYAQNNPEYAKGDEIRYDFDQIETILANGLAFGKCHLVVSFNKFIFSKEFFHSCGRLLSEIRELLPQSSSLPDDVRQGLANLKECRIKEAQTLLQHIEVLIFLLKRVKCDTDVTLQSFAEEWLSMLPSPFPVSLLPQPSNSIKLKHITALYEALEDILADGVIKGVPDQFRGNLTDDMKDQLNHLVDKEERKLPLQVFITAMRRFVFRYLSSEKFLPEPSKTLRSCLKEPSLWSSCGEPLDFDLIPKELTLARLHAVVTHLQSLNKERKSNAKKSAKAGRPISRPQVVTKGRRRTMKF